MQNQQTVDPASLPLRDIHLPEPISWWPPAVGWWLLGILFLLLGLFCFWLVRRRSSRRFRRHALRELTDLQQLPAKDQLTALSRLLRRCAVWHYPPESCAGLTGADWLAFLDRPFADRPFSHGPGQLLQAAPYRREEEQIPPELLGLAERWIRQLPPLKSGQGRRS